MRVVKGILTWINRVQLRRNRRCTSSMSCELGGTHEPRLFSGRPGFVSILPDKFGLFETGRIAPGKSGHTHPCVSPDNFAVEVTNRAWIRAAVAPFAQRKFSILLDTRTLEEQYQSRFRCLRRDSRFSVHSQFL